MVFLTGGKAAILYSGFKYSKYCNWSFSQASPWPDIIWLKDNVPVTKRVTISNSDSSSQLLIPSSERLDSGIYSILVKNLAGQETFSTEVRVTAKTKTLLLHWFQRHAVKDLIPLKLTVCYRWSKASWTSRTGGKCAWHCDGDVGTFTWWEVGWPPPLHSVQAGLYQMHMDHSGWQTLQ